MPSSDLRLSTTLRTIPDTGQQCHNCRRCNIQAKVSSMLTISLAEVSMKPQPRDLAHSQPVLLLTILESFRSHLLPATIMTGGIRHPSSRRPRTLVPFSRSSLLFSSTLFSASILTMSRNHWRPSRELEFVISYTSRKASDCRFDAAHRPRYSSCPAVSVRER